MTPREEWDRCAPWLEAALALANGTHDIDDVRREIERREACFWAGRKAAMVTTEQVYPKFKTFTFWLAGGDLTELVEELRPKAEAFHIARGCRFGTIYGRRGWVRQLAPYGYREVHTTVAKELA